MIHGTDSEQFKTDSATRKVLSLTGQDSLIKDIGSHSSVFAFTIVKYAFGGLSTVNLSESYSGIFICDGSL